MNNFPIALAAGFAVLLIIIVIGVRSAARGRNSATDASGDATNTTVDSSSADCGGGADGGGCD